MKPTLNRFFSLFATVVACASILGAVAALKVAIAAEQGMLMPSAPKTIEPFGYTDAEGKGYTVDAHKGKVVIVHFWAKWCPPCIEELPLMQDALTKLDAGDDLVVLPLSLDRTVEVVQTFYAENDITLPLYMDEKSRAMRALGIRGLPSTVILDGEGREIARRAGVVDWQSEAVIGVIEDALAKNAAPAEAAAE